MRVALYCEGASDAAVLTNILKGVLNIDKSDVKYDLPELEYDETDLYNQRNEQFSSWSIVKSHCENPIKIDMFLNSVDDSNRFVIIQIDSAERNEFGFDVLIPNSKTKNYVEYSLLLRNNVKDKINNWMQNKYNDKIAYAISIEEIESWIITQFENYKFDTSKENKPKEYFKKNLDKLYKNKKTIIQINNIDTFSAYCSHSYNFRTNKKINAYRLKNKSLDLFCSELENFKNL